MNHRIEKPNFKDSSHRAPFYSHSQIQKPPLKKRRLNNPKTDSESKCKAIANANTQFVVDEADAADVDAEMKTDQTTETPENAENTNENAENANLNNNNLASAQKEADTLNETRAIWHYLDQIAAFYYTRFLRYQSLCISDHFSYLNQKSADFSKTQQNQHIYMAEIPPEKMEEFLSVKPPDKRIPEKYWYQRYRYFSKFDDGIQLDLESWY